jgi:hypothetical protein
MGGGPWLSSSVATFATFTGTRCSTLKSSLAPPRWTTFDRLLAASSTITDVVFDLLALNNRALIARPIEDRRRILEEIVEEGGVLARSRAFIDGSALYREAIRDPTCSDCWDAALIGPVRRRSGVA